jgi:hypothetical protein
MKDTFCCNAISECSEFFNLRILNEKCHEALGSCYVTYVGGEQSEEISAGSFA